MSLITISPFAFLSFSFLHIQYSYHFRPMAVVASAETRTGTTDEGRTVAATEYLLDGLMLTVAEK